MNSCHSTRPSRCADVLAAQMAATSVDSPRPLFSTPARVYECPHPSCQERFLLISNVADHLQKSHQAKWADMAGGEGGVARHDFDASIDVPSRDYPPAMFRLNGITYVIVLVKRDGMYCAWVVAVAVESNLR